MNTADSDRCRRVNLNGKLTLGENTADNGGLRVAYMALMNTLASEPHPLRGRRSTATRRRNVISSVSARYGAKTSGNKPREATP